MKKNSIITSLCSVLLCLMCAVLNPGNAQTVIGGNTPHPSAMLDVQSDSKGVLFPRMNSAQRGAIEEPATGLIIFNTETFCIEINLGTPANPGWQKISCGAVIAALNCNTATLTGVMNESLPATGVSVSVPYTGGNGEAHQGQTVTSTGVEGLTATLSAGTLASGAGNLAYDITGTPTSGGTASFALSIGGQSCTLEVTVQNAGTISALTCASATLTGNLSNGQAASSVSASVPYTGGNGGVHQGQTVTSTGVEGLTATLLAGTFASGAGNLTYDITGTPTSEGTASFALSIGGQSCTLEVSVVTPFLLNCASAIRKGEMQPDFIADGVSVIVPYTGGDGSVHNGQTVNSTGVTGYTATLDGGTFASGNGTLTYTITGTSASTGDAIFALNIGGHTCDLDLSVRSCSAKVSATETKIFLCYNLGAHNTRVDPFTPSWEINGNYYQWGRNPSCFGTATSNPCTSPVYGAAGPWGSTAATSNSGSISGWDLSNDSADTDWRATGTKGPQDPCPSGFRVPSGAQWEAVIANNTAVNVLNPGGSWTNGVANYTSGKKIGDDLFLPAAGYRWTIDGLPIGGLSGRGSFGDYWSSTVDGGGARQITTAINLYRMDTWPRTYGLPVRCVAEDI